MDKRIRVYSIECILVRTLLDIRVALSLINGVQYLVLGWKLVKLPALELDGVAYDMVIPVEIANPRTGGIQKLQIGYNQGGKAALLDLKSEQCDPACVI